MIMKQQHQQEVLQQMIFHSPVMKQVIVYDYASFLYAITIQNKDEPQ